MQSIYAKKNETTQRIVDNFVASVLDNSSQSEGLQRKADMTNNAVVQRMRGHNRGRHQQRPALIPVPAPVPTPQTVLGRQWNILNLIDYNKMSDRGLAAIQTLVNAANGPPSYGHNFHRGINGFLTMDIPGQGGRGDLRLQFFPDGRLRVTNHNGQKESV